MDYFKYSEKFLELYGVKPKLYRSPGRINIIGEHTDYNEGFVLPAGINKEICVAISANGSETCRLYSYDLKENFEFHLNKLQKTNLGWPNYIMGVIDQLQKKGFRLSGFNCVFGGDIPFGSGLSSSAALECCIATAMENLFDLKMDSIDKVLIAQKAEVEFVGVNCGIMDQFASVFSEEDKAILLDCRDMSYELIDIDLSEYEFILINSMVKHSLASSEYNDRRRDCEAVVQIISEKNMNVKALRDVPLNLLKINQAEISEVEYKRAEFIIKENERVGEAAKAIKNKDFKRLGELLYESHEGLSKKYEVSCPELDFLVDRAKSIEGVLGARMMGGGFGGCTINLVSRSNVNKFKEEVSASYQHRFGVMPELYSVETASGSSGLNF